MTINNQQNGTLYLYTNNNNLNGIQIANNGSIGISTGPNSGYRLAVRLPSGSSGGITCANNGGNTAFDVAQYGTWTNGSSAGGWNGNNTVVYLSKDSGTSRSLNAAGTLNASGADYAEYMVKDVVEEVILKGSIVGIKENGKLTTKWSESKSFMIKSTNPSYVGGDSWGCVGARPQQPKDVDGSLHNEEYQKAMAAYEAKVQAERLKVDRVAYSGQVPVNVFGAAAGDYIVAAEGQADSITGVVVRAESLSFPEYTRAVGRVIKLLDDGRAFVNVMVH